MKNRTQIERKNNSRAGDVQRRGPRAGVPQLADSAAILFDSLYEYSRVKSFDEAVCEFEALLELTKHHPCMRSENAALRLIVDGAERLQKCQAVTRSAELDKPIRDLGR
jgi:hypothetical protein